MKKKYFHEVIEEEAKILAIGLKQSIRNKEERSVKRPVQEKTVSEQLQDELEPIE